MSLKPRFYNLLIHLLLWILLLLALNTVFHLKLHHVQWGPDGQSHTYEFDIFVYRALLYGVTFKVVLFYVNGLVLLKQYSKSRNSIKYIFQILTLVILCYGLEFGFRYLMNKPYRNSNNEDAIAYVNRMNIVFYILIMGFSFVYFFFKEWTINEKIKNRLIKEQLTNELNLLKFQINPHFLFNTLNNLFSIAQEHGDVELKSGIFNLSGIMRYIIYDSNAPMTKLQKEIDYLEDYIDIFKLKYTPEDDITISFKVDGEPSSKSIAPMLLIPFVENAFKHGVSLKNKSLIQIVINIRENDVYFSVVNTNHSYINRSADTGSGIGLTNVQKRLNLIYADNYFLKIDSGEHYHSIQLTLPLNLTP